MTTTQKQKAALGVLALLGAIISSPFLMGAVRAFDGRYVHQSEYQSDHALLLRIDSTTKSTAGRVSKMFCASLPAEKRGGCE